MTHYLKPCGYSMFLLAALAGGPAAAQDGKEEPNKETALLKQLADLKASLEATKTDLGQLQAELRLLTQNTQKEVINLRKEIEELRKALPAGISVKDTEDLKKQFDRVEAALKALEKQTVTTLKPNDRLPPEGRIVLRNNYPTTVDFILNGVTYTVRPGSDYEVKLPAGKFAFRIPAIAGYQIDQARMLGLEKPYVITVE